MLQLWALLFDEGDRVEDAPWRSHAREWLERLIDDRRAACFPVVEVDDGLVATAIGTLELGVPNPHCLRGRTVRLANVVTRPEHRGSGFATLLVHEIVEWARSVEADRVDLSATAEGQRIYSKIGFVPTSAPRMKLLL